MGPLEDIQQASLIELVNALRPFAAMASPEYPNSPYVEARRLVEKWDRAFEVWGWKQNNGCPRG